MLEVGPIAGLGGSNSTVAAGEWLVGAEPDSKGTVAVPPPQATSKRTAIVPDIAPNLAEAVPPRGLSSEPDNTLVNSSHPIEYFSLIKQLKFRRATR